MDYNALILAQRKFFNSGRTKDLLFRKEQLLKLRSLIKGNEKELYEAIYGDFGKSVYETYLTELSQIYKELKMASNNLGRWNKKKRIRTNLVNFPARSYILPEPLGNCLIIGAWNYPFYLSLVPAISAIAAGNTVIIKPSEVAKRTSKVMAGIINAAFPAGYLHVVEGGVQETTQLLKVRFDKIFFTGSTQVAPIIYRAAADHLTPVTLELGGKSPTFVLKDCHIKTTAKRIVWAKFLNAGQTCVAPDYVLVEEEIKAPLQEALKEEILAHYSVNEERENYTQIINLKNFDRLHSLIDKEKIYHGGQSDRKKRMIYPTILQNVDFDHAIMKQEIFGPILPIISFNQLDEAIDKVNELPRPLSCYVYSGNKKRIKKIIGAISFGGGAVNESLVQLSNILLPFGGVGFSGMGNYHGEYGFKTFSHEKSILHKRSWLEPPIKYFPYSSWKKKLIRWLIS